MVKTLFLSKETRAAGSYSSCQAVRCHFHEVHKLCKLQAARMLHACSLHTHVDAGLSGNIHGVNLHRIL